MCKGVGTEPAVGASDSLTTDLMRVRGQLFLARFAWLSEYHGANSIDLVLSELTPEEQQPLRSVERQGWYPWSAFIHLDEAIARLFAAPGDLSIFERLGAASACRRTEWLGEHAPLVSAHTFLKRAAEEHRTFQNFGRAAYRRAGFAEAVLEFSDYPTASPVFCRSARGFLRAAVEILSQSPVRIEERLCQSRGERCCQFSLRWGADAATGRTARCGHGE